MSQIDVTTTAAEKMAFAVEQTIRRTLGNDTVRSAEAEMIRALAADRDRYRFNRVPGEDFVVTDEVVDYVLRYGGRCRDCADEDGVCPASGLPCAGREKAVRFVLDALSYGLRHGFLKLRS